VLVSSAVLAAAGGADPATGSPQRASPCKRLEGRDVAPARNVKVVRRRNDEGGTDLLGCVLPRGRVRVLASSIDQETTVESYRIRRLAGAIVLLATSHDSQYATVRSTSVFNVRSGREYLVARTCSRLDGVACGGSQATAAAAFVNRRGQAAAALLPPGTSTTTIVGFSSRGDEQTLDSGLSAEVPASSLRLRGTTVSWTHSGATRTATLSG
jgi:hypothetical protein